MSFQTIIVTLLFLLLMGLFVAKAQICKFIVLSQQLPPQNGDIIEHEHGPDQTDGETDSPADDTG